MNARTDVVERLSSAAGRAVGQAQALADRAVPEEDRSLIGRVMELPLRKKLTLARALWRDPRMSSFARAPLIAGLAYAVVPIKVTPKVLGPLREFEKVVGLGALLWVLIRLAPHDVIREHLDKIERPGLWDRIRGK